MDSSRFIIESRAGEVQPAPDGWELDFNKRKKSFKLLEKPSREKKAKWTFSSPPDFDVLGCWWSPEYRYLGWVARQKGGSRRVLEALDVVKRKKWRVSSNPDGGELGEVMIFIPNSNNVVFPYRRFMVISDVRGGNQSMIMVITRDGPRFRGGKAAFLRCSADGLEMAMGVPRDMPDGGKKGKSAGRKGEASPEMDVWRMHMTLKEQM